MKYEQVRQNTTLIADSKELVFKDGVCEVKTMTKDIQALIDVGYLKKIEETQDGKTSNS